MKAPSTFLLIALLWLVGCSSANTQQPPSALTQTLFTVQTNIVTQTNWLTQTNLVIQTVTNVANQVVTLTNTVTKVVPQIVTLTNYAFAPNPALTNTIQSAGSLGGPIGTVIAYGLTGILGIVAFLKNKQANTLATVAGVSQQALATAQQVIGALPNGSALLAQFNAWLAAHQGDVDFAQELAQTVENFVDQTKAQTTAAGIVAQAAISLPAPAQAK
jgi:hypothetical protein